MLLCSITVLLLVIVAYRDVRSSLCDSTNCSAAKLKNFSCEEGYEKEVELFKNRHGGREQYDYPEDSFPSKPYVRVSYIRLNEYWNSSKILEYNKEYNTNVTHGLEIGFTEDGNRGNTSLFMKFSSTNKFNNAKDHFYEAHPEKRVLYFSSSKTVITHLCLQGLQTRPVSYTVLLTVFPEWESAIGLWRPSSTNHYMSFSKDNLAVAVSNYPLKTDIRVVYDTPSDQDMCTCVRMLHICKDSGGCVKNSTEQCQDVNNFKNNYVSASYVWSSRSPGRYYVKIEFHCVSMRNGEERERDFYLKSSVIEIPRSFRKV
ncbi:uncharacterized protein LOC130048374 isoform X2 [Ostrea edulis]|uniref:uncharacterized protein LOC130048374 isoform X2 n=1 Tax=Ostrea edulis TaxID=37623 RepID=UPI0024AF0985|nr:uncharacterized protein LOC130048374 isoform X2 [Ostrea edulis]